MFNTRIPLSAFVFEFVYFQLSACARHCNEDISVEIRNHTLLQDKGLLDHETNILYPPSSFWESDGVYKGCICDLKLCIRKCCQNNEIMVNNSCTPSWKPSNFTVAFLDDENHEKYARSPDMHIINGLPPDCGSDYFFLESSDEYYLSRNGILHLLPNFNYDMMQYCYEYEGGREKIVTALCFSNEPEIPITYRIGLIISTPFLLVTFLVYACLQELRNYHGKSLMCYVSSLLISFICLSLVQAQFIHSNEICILFGFALQFSFTATFFWLNAMCFDIWWAFSGLGAFRGPIQCQQRRKFIIYSLYAWGSPLVISSLTTFVQFYPEYLPNGWTTPEIGLEKCWFKNKEAELFYFYGPIGIILSSNIIFFILTTAKIMDLKKETAVLKHRDSRRYNNNDRQRFFLYLKLFVLMGVNWILDVISWSKDDQESFIFYAIDIFNTLEGVMIFVLFICTPKTLKLINQKLRSIKESSFKATSSTKITSTNSKEQDNVSLQQSNNQGPCVSPES